jgi:hypothetical protein
MFDETNVYRCAREHGAAQGSDKLRGLKHLNSPDGGELVGRTA